MALNDLFKSKSLLTVESLKSIIFDFKSRLNKAKTEKERIIIESQFLEYLNKSLDKKIDVRKVSPFEKATSENIIVNKLNTKYNVLANTGQIDSLSSYYLESVNYMNQLIAQVNSKIRRIEQKRSVLSDWNDNNIKFLLKEKFLTLENVNFELSKIKPMSIDVYQGIATLPILSSTKANVFKASIRSGNGMSGNSNSLVTRNNFNLKNMLNDDQNTWYEYERLDDGPVSIKIQLLLNEETIVNEILLNPYFDESSGGYQIKNVVFLDSNGRQTNLRNLISYNLDEDYFFINSNSNYWGCKFVPTKASSVLIEFESNLYERTENLRKRYSIGVRSIVLNSNKYSDKGFVNSSIRPLVSELNVVLPKVDYYPNNSNLFSCSLGFSLSEGADWENFNIEDIKENKEKIVNDESSLLWKLNLNRENSNFEIYSSFSGEEEYNYNFLQKTFPRGKGVKEIKVSKKVIDKDFFVIEKGFLNKSFDKKKLITLSRLNNRKFILSNDTIAAEQEYCKVPLPINIYDSNIEKEDIEIFVNFKEYEQKESLEDVKTNSQCFCFSDDGGYIYVSSDIPERSTIKWKSTPEEIVPEERESYFYCPFESLFDPEKTNLKLSAVSSERKSKTLKLNLSKTFFKLSDGHIYESSIKVKRSDGTVLSQVEDLSNLDENKYYFSSKKNILVIKGNRGDRGMSVYFEYKDRRVLDSKDYEIWYGDNTINGVKIHKNLVGVEEIEEDLTEKRNVFSQKKSKEIEIENLFSSNNKFYIGKKGIVKNSLKVLSNKKIKEVEFIDGESEFYNLIKIENEKTNEMNANSSGFVEFMVSAGTQWWSGTGIEFDNKEVFKNDVGSVSAIVAEGDWAIEESGKITLLQDSIPEGINYSYYYSNGEEIVESYSVDYKNGFVYFSPDLEFVDTLKVKYKLLDIIAEYSLAKRVQNVETNDNILKINTDLLYNKISDVRVFYKESKEKENLKNYKDYFSPLIYSVDFRFK